MPTVVVRDLKRRLFLVLGLLFLGLALVGIVVPGLPTTINTIIAGYFFARSSERFDRWLTEHATLGPIIRDWRAGQGFTRRVKTVAMTAMTVSIAVSGWLIGVAWIQAILAVCWVWASWMILSQPTKQRPEVRRIKAEHRT